MKSALRTVTEIGFGDVIILKWFIWELVVIYCDECDEL
jgi:hypothetical protein